MKKLIEKTNSKYRILKLYFTSGRVKYVIQKRTRFFWIGPKIWETYDDQSSWTYFIHFGRTYDEFSYAEDSLKSLIRANDSIEKMETIKEI